MDSGTSPKPARSAEDVARITQALDRLSARIEAAERRSAAAISGVDETVRSVIHRLDTAEHEQADAAARLEGAVQDVQHEQIRIAERLRGVEAQAHGPRSAEAIKALESALTRVANRFHNSEGAISATIAERLEDAENRTSSALRGLQASFATLDSRLKTVEAAAPGGAEARLEELAATLSSRVDAARAEMAERMRATADTRFDGMERALAEMSEHVRAAEDRSTAAIEHMGREVVAIAETLGKRVQTVEERGAEAIEQVSGEVGRIAQVVESRLGTADTAQAQALERLGQEVSRITERLSERIANSERRAAQAIDEVGEQVARVTERISQRHERASTDLADRIQQSEERTAKLLDEARGKIEKLAASHAPAESPETVEPAAPLPEYPGFEAAPVTIDASFPGRPYRRALGARFAGGAALAPIFETDHQYAAEYEPEPVTIFKPREVETVAFSPEDFDAAGALTIAEPEAEALAEDEALARLDLELDARTDETQESDDDAVHLETGLEPVEAAAAEHLERADATALEPIDGEADHFEVEAASDDEAFFDADDAEEPTPEAVLQAVAAEPASFASAEAYEPEIEAEDFEAVAPARPLTTRDIIERARVAAQARETTPRRRGSRDEASPLFAARYRRSQKSGVTRGAVAMSLTAAASVGVALAGFTMIQSSPQGRLPKTMEDALALARGKAETAKPQAAVALGFKPIDAAAASAAPAADLSTAYSAAVVKVETNGKSGVEDLTRVANLGYAPAQFYLGKLYEDGTAGVKKDPAEARRWYERAAEAGERKAMHNLAMLYYYGEGGAKNSTTAGQWFRRAADLGLVDSQYNLGQLYEQGFGVSQNPAEAYKWYLVAARSGDADSKLSAARVRALLTLDARTAAERAAAAFNIGAPAAPAAPVMTQAANDLVTAQKALSTLGYYQGPSDGLSSPALRLALAAYQRDQGLPATGVADATTVTKLASLQR